MSTTLETSGIHFKGVFVNTIHPHHDPLYVFKKIFRTTKVLAPSLTDAKYAAQRLGRRLAGRPHERDFHVLALLKEPKSEQAFLFLDIGANRGQTIDSVRMFKDYYIVSVEANPLLAQKILHQRRGDKRLKILNYAMSNSRGETTLYLPKYRDYVFDGLASTIYSEAESWLNESRIYGFRRELLSITKMRTPMTTVDELGLAPDFIKIDVQGAELLVLQGARKTLENYRPILLVELPSYESEGRFLADLAYRPYFFQNGRFQHGISEHHGNSFFFTEQHRTYFPATAFVDM